jgi:hypothetical protein
MVKKPLSSRSLSGKPGRSNSTRAEDRIWESIFGRQLLEDRIPDGLLLRLTRTKPKDLLQSCTQVADRECNASSIGCTWIGPGAETFFLGHSSLAGHRRHHGGVWPVVA